MNLTAISKPFTVVALAAALCLGVVACSSDEPRDPDNDPELVSDPDDEDVQVLCAAACDVLVGPCSEGASNDPGFNDPRALTSCRADCLQGAFDPDELTCFASTSCGEPVDSCFD